jgi:hypothetical protein
MNSQLTQIPSTLLRQKLARLAIRLQQQVNPDGSNTDYNTLEKSVSEAIQILSKFYTSLSSSGFIPQNAIAGTPPTAIDFNNNMLGIQDDLLTIFNEFENMESVVVGEFNYLTSRLNRLNTRIKSVASHLGDYALYSNLATKDATFFSDSFNSLQRLEVNSPLLNKEQCEVNQDEGIVTLPVDRQAQGRINITETPAINSNSNGTVGNNEQPGAELHGTITDILDGNADTWFEYERIIQEDDGTALVLDITINLGLPKVINSITINPNNFGTRTPVEIVSLDTASNGNIYTSIKDDIPIADFTVEDEENIFLLAPATSKFAGQGRYTFTPRKVKYIHLTLKQSSPYLITTTSGTQKLRYAIGIRDVIIEALPYKSEGEVISTNYETTEEIKKLVLLCNQNPDPSTVSSLTLIDHFVSPDNGITWHQIRPKVSSGQMGVVQSVPELLDFNGYSDQTITTSNPVYSLRYKATLKRNTTAFKQDSAELAEKIVDTTELHTPPSTTPFTIALQQIPIKDTLRVIDPNFGSCGYNERFYIGAGIGIASQMGGAQLIIQLSEPFKLDPWGYKKAPISRQIINQVGTLVDLAPEKIYVDGVKWTNGPLASTNTCYSFDREKGKITFGDGTSGMAPRLDGVIEMSLDSERIYPDATVNHIAQLNFSATPKKGIEQTTIIDFSAPISCTQVLARGAYTHQLKPFILGASAGLPATTGVYKMYFSSPSVFTSPKVYQDGLAEFATPGTGEYSVNFDTGILTTRTATGTAYDTYVTYTYTPYRILTDSEWDFVPSPNGVANAITIKDSSFKTYSITPMTISSGVTYFVLSNGAIVPGSLKFIDSTTNTTPVTLKQEIPFIDGRTEFLGVIQTSETMVPITGTGGLITIPFRMKISTDTALPVTFSQPDIFKVTRATQSDVAGGSVGDYWIDRGTVLGSPTGGIYVKLGAPQPVPGLVHYYYTDPRAVMAGKYSVNNKTGEVYSYTTTGSNITASCEYTNYSICYHIAREVVLTDWEYNDIDNKIIIKDNEILKVNRIPQSAPVNPTSNRYYQVSYRYVETSREAVSELEPYFSPVLKNYALKITTKSGLL